MKYDRFVKPNRCDCQFHPCGCASSPDLLCILHFFSFEADSDAISYEFKKRLPRSSGEPLSLLALRNYFAFAAALASAASSAPTSMVQPVFRSASSGTQV